MFYGFYKLDGALLDLTKDEVHPIRSKIKYTIWTIVGVFLVFCWVVGGEVVEVGKSMVNSVMRAFGEKMELPETEGIELNYNVLMEDGVLGLEPIRARIARTVEYESDQALYEGTGFTLPENEALKYSGISACVYTREKSGGVKATLQYETKAYELFGIFLIEDYTPEDTVLDFEQGNVASSIYEMENGENAYFLRDWRYDIYNVYFKAKDVLYQMTIPSTKEDVANVEKIVDLMAE